MNTRTKAGFVRSASVFAIALLLPVPALAQATDGTADEEQSQPQEIIVTAQRRSENVLKVPLSVTVVSSDQLTQRGANDANPVGTAPPVLTLNQRFSFESVRTFGVRLGVNF